MLTIDYTGINQGCSTKKVELSRTYTQALPLIIGVTLTIMLFLMIIMTRVGAVVGTLKTSEEEVELNQQRSDNARMERILISTTSLA